MFFLLFPRQNVDNHGDYRYEEDTSLKPSTWLMCGRRASPSAQTVRGDTYHVYVPSLSPLMLCIGGITITTGEHHVRRRVVP
jgi:hypothetical protein